MRLRIGDTTLRANLAHHFERSSFAVEREHDLLRVERGDALTAAQARRETEAHLLIWQVMHPEAVIEIVD